jgi:small nuclear ribonucleoprotein
METPTDVLDRLIEQRVELRLKDNRTVSGRLLGSDQHMNLVLDEAEERTPELTRRLGRVLLRGSTVISLDAATFPPKRR